MNKFGLPNAFAGQAIVQRQVQTPASAATNPYTLSAAGNLAANPGMQASFGGMKTQLPEKVVKPSIAGFGKMFNGLSDGVAKFAGTITGGRVNQRGLFQAPKGSASIGIRG